MENKTARLTVLVDPTRKEAFERLCHSQDMTPSQVMRRLIRDWMAQHAAPPLAAPSPRKAAPAKKGRPGSDGAGKANGIRAKPDSRR